VDLGERSAVAMQDVAVYLRLGDLESAHQALEDAIAAAREFLGRHEVPRVRYLLSRLLRARGLSDEALVALDRAIAGDPDLVEARFERGLMLSARPSLSGSERAAAITDLEHALGARAVLAQVDRLFGRGELCRLQGRTREAVDLLEEVLAYDLIHVAARTSLARLALELGDQNLAWHYAVSAVDLQQGFGPVYLARDRRVMPVAILGLDGALSDFAADVAGGPDNARASAPRPSAPRSRTTTRRSSSTPRPPAPTTTTPSAGCRPSASPRPRATAPPRRTRTGASRRISCARSRSTRCSRRRISTAASSRCAASPSCAASGRPESTARRLDQARAAFRAALAHVPAAWPHRRTAEARLSDVDRMASLTVPR
jgi:tetratricopeptide (TPR) repeat protein